MREGRFADEPSAGRAAHPGATPDFDVAPFLVIWEVTRACALICRHCRASAEDRRDPRELTTDEGRRLLDAVAGMGTPIVVLTGGDPLQRDDLEDLVCHGKAAGLRVGAIPAETPRLNRERVASLAAAGLDQMALSLDGARPETHDAFRGVAGCFDIAIAAAAWAREARVPLQINTVVCADNAAELPAIAELVERMGAVFWEVFLLVPAGRGALLSPCSAEQAEKLLGDLVELAARAPFLVKIAEAPHYRRIAMERGLGAAPGAERRGPGRMGLSPMPVSAGRGFCFVDHVGDVHPSGFLPWPAGNVRTGALADIYRHSGIFRALRDANRLRGRCGRCEFRAVCGGSRSRAYALTGDPFAEDPACAYDPPAGPSAPVARP